MDVSSSPQYQMQAQHADVLCGSCPPGSAPQTSALWPGQTPGTGFPSWPAQATQQILPTQQASQPAPCWTGQPNTPCWLGTQPLPVSGPSPLPVPPQILTPSPAPPASMIPASAPAPTVAPAPSQICQPCWPGQYQPAQPPVQAQVPFQVPALSPVPVPAPAPVSAPAHAPTPSLHPSLPTWTAHPGWPYNPGQPGWPGQNPALVPKHWLPPTSGPLSVPYNLNLARGVYDKMMMTILGQIKPNAKMFTINFLRGNDIAFHINPRFGEGGKQVLVRNHKVGEHWGPEERDLKGPFPFALGSPFEVTSPRVECQANVWLKRWKGLERRLGKLILDQGNDAPQGDSWRPTVRVSMNMKDNLALKRTGFKIVGQLDQMKILCTQDSFRVAVNNIPLFEFRHRVRELNQINRINILHDVVLTYVNVETLP